MTAEISLIKYRKYAIFSWVIINVRLLLLYIQAVAENDIRTEGLIALKEVIHNNEFITTLDLSGQNNTSLGCTL